MSHPDGKKLTEHIELVDLGTGYLLFDDREADSPFWFDNEEAVARYISNHATEETFYALGDLVKTTLGKLGIENPCLPCAKRQAKLNRLLRRRRK